MIILQLLVTRTFHQFVFFVFAFDCLPPSDRCHHLLKVTLSHAKEWSTTFPTLTVSCHGNWTAALCQCLAFHVMPPVLNSYSPLSVCVSPSYIFFIALSMPMLLVHLPFLLPSFSLFISVSFNWDADGRIIQWVIFFFPFASSHSGSIGCPPPQTKLARPMKRNFVLRLRYMEESKYQDVNLQRICLDRCG